ncbi:E3 ubiquitin-protein ligase UPL3 [Pelomyxa schiedti]|nr:E3 ubiquitin-protein ligase UPL3 [Pelomyxa schiedti]
MQLASLENLSQLLAVATEENLSGCSIEEIITEVLKIMSAPSDSNFPMEKLYASRALAHILEAIPNIGNTMVASGTAQVLCETLRQCGWDDLTDQTLSTLCKLSVQNPVPVLRAGGLLSVMQNLDFFTENMQRSAIQTVANLCRQAPGDAFNECIKEALSPMALLLKHHDKKVVENAILCFARLVESFRESEPELQEIFKCDFVSLATPLLAGGSTGISPQSTCLLMRTLSTLCASPQVTCELLDCGAIKIIKEFLSRFVESNKTSSPSKQGTNTPQYLLEVLHLANEIMPPMPPALLMDFSNQRHFFRSLIQKYKTTAPAPTPPGSIPPSETGDTSQPQEPTATVPPVQVPHPKEIIFQSKPDVLLSYAKGLFGPITQIFSTSSQQIRQPCLVILLKLLHFCAREGLDQVLLHANFPVFLASALGSEDVFLQFTGLQMCDIVVAKTPQLIPVLRREGVITEVQNIIKATSTALAPSSGGSLSGSSSGALLGRKYSSLPSLREQVLCDQALGAFASGISQKCLEKAGEVGDSNVAVTLTKLVKQLSAITYETPEAEQVRIMTEIKDLLAQEDGVSTFEFIDSGLIKAYLDFFTKVDKPGEPEVIKEKYLTTRICTFVSVYMPPKQTGTTPAVTLPPPLSVLLHKLHDALNKCERLPVVLNDTPNLGGGLKLLTEPMKVTLQPDPSETELKPITEESVPIEALATIAAIEDYLWPKVCPETSARIPPRNVASSGGLDNSASTSAASATASTPAKSATKAPVDVPAPPQGTEKASKMENEGEGAIQKDAKRPKTVTQSLQPPGDGDEQEEQEEDQERDFMEDVSVRDVNITEEIPTQPATATTSTTSSSSNLTTSSSNTPTTSKSATPPQQNRHLVFSFNGEELATSSTFYEIVQNFVFPSSDSTSSLRPVQQLWDVSHVFTYKQAKLSSRPTPDAVPVSPSVKLMPVESNPFLFQLLSFVPPLPLVDTTSEIIALLYVLHSISKNAHSICDTVLPNHVLVTPVEFVNQKLAYKLLRQLQDPLTVCGRCLPPWTHALCTRCSFLFPLDCRQMYFHCTSFGMAHALHVVKEKEKAEQVGSARDNNRESDRLGRIPRQKVRIERSQILPSAMKVMELGNHKSILEVQYFGEEGTGLGPTLEFFTLVSHEIQRDWLDIWYNENGKPPPPPPPGETFISSASTTNFVDAPGGLFPAPVHRDKWDTVNKHRVDIRLPTLDDIFFFLGKITAKAIMDQRFLDLHFSRAFYKWMLGKSLSLGDFAQLSVFGKNLAKLVDISKQFICITHSSSLSAEDKAVQLSKLKVGETTVEDLYLDFTLPTDQEWELIENGKNVPVTLDTLSDYLDRVVQTMLIGGVARQLDCFFKGFQAVFPIKSLSVFTEDELELQLCGCDDTPWTQEALRESITLDHGYTWESPAVQYLISIMSQFTKEERRQFVLFLTGSPNLPPGGFNGLNPRCTVVQQTHESQSSLIVDHYLPTVNCCFYYLKLPSYSTREIMKEKLLYTIYFGQNCFDKS